MLPGVIAQYGGFDNVMKGQIVAIRVAGNRYSIGHQCSSFPISVVACIMN